jgi:guanylate cyclase soluble subunit alpha
MFFWFLRKLFKSDFRRLFSSETSLEAAMDQRFAPVCEELLQKFFIHLLDIHNKPQNKSLLKSMQKKLGQLYFKHLNDEFEKPLRSIGASLYSFFNNLNSLHESLLNHAHFGPRFLFLNESFTGYTPSFRCQLISPESGKPGTGEFLIFTIQESTSIFMQNFYYGLIESIASLLWNLKIKIEKIRKNSEKSILNSPNILTYKIRYSDSAENQSNFMIGCNELSNKPDDLCVSNDILKSIFPFSIVIDRDLNMKQMGDGLLKHLDELLQSNGFHFSSYFDIIKPKLNEHTFESLLMNHNMTYRLKFKKLADSSQLKEMELKGSLVYLAETDCLMFIGSPIIQHLEELTGRGLYISDIPIHDATRDIILVSEQTKAQEGLKFRMEKLKKSIVSTHESIEEEKHKNIELLNMIFPSEIAKRLWAGERVNASSVTNVTLLYSDIVGFTAICSTSQPIEVIEMLKRLYTDFDFYCGLLDVYKIETIGGKKMY